VGLHSRGVGFLAKGCYVGDTRCDIVKDNGGKVAVFNIELNSPSDKIADFAFVGPACQGVGTRR